MTIGHVFIIMIKIKPHHLISSLLIILCGSVASADVVETRDGTTVNGKVLKKTADTVVFRNSYGTFYIKKSKIVKLHETSSYKEDIKIFRKKGITVNEKGIAKNYESGAKKKIVIADKQANHPDLPDQPGHANLPNQPDKEIKLIQPDKKNQPVDPNKKNQAYQPNLLNFYRQYLDYSLTPFGYAGLGTYSDLLPWGVSLSLNIDLELDDILYGTKNPLLPDIKTDISYFQMGFGTETIRGPLILAGPVWSVRIVRIGKIFLSPLFGAGFYNARSKSGEASAVKFTMSSISGLKYSFRGMTILPQIRYTYIHDRDLPFSSIGLGVGMEY